jgi:hypothetical protein
MKYLIAIVLALGQLSPALAQLRTIPNDAKPGVMRHLQDMVVEIDGKPRHLAPGAQIRDPDNRLLVPASLAEKSTVRYLVDGAGLVHRVWVLTPREKAALPPDPIPK